MKTPRRFVTVWVPTWQVGRAVVALQAAGFQEVRWMSKAPDAPEGQALIEVNVRAATSDRLVTEVAETLAQAGVPNQINSVYAIVGQRPSGRAAAHHPQTGAGT